MRGGRESGGCERKGKSVFVSMCSVCMHTYRVYVCEREAASARTHSTRTIGVSAAAICTAAMSRASHTGKPNAQGGCICVYVWKGSWVMVWGAWGKGHGGGRVNNSVRLPHCHAHAHHLWVR